MIVGTGMIASAFAPYFANDEQVVVFASGVSHSRELRKEQFERERELLLDALSKGRYLVYFSTCSIEDPELRSSPYVMHKVAMEQLVQRAGKFAIFRLPQVVGTTPNPTTLTNYLFGRISSAAGFQVWIQARRNIVDIDDVASIGAHLVRSHDVDNTTTNIACPFSISIVDLVKIFESVLGKQAHYERVASGGSYEIDAALAADVAARLGIRFDDHYVENVIGKYYGRRTA